MSLALGIPPQPVDEMPPQPVDGPDETLSVKKTTLLENLFFLLWTPDLGDGLGFIMAFAQELTNLGHTAVLESPVDGLNMQLLDAGMNFSAQVNPMLQKVLSGELNAWDVAVRRGVQPHFIVLFSDAWHPSLFDARPEHPDVQMLWFFYRARNCKRHEDCDEVFCGHATMPI